VLVAFGDGSGAGHTSGHYARFMHLRESGFAYQGKDIVFRLIIEYSSLRDFGPY
jgi:hypothetical protein